MNESRVGKWDFPLVLNKRLPIHLFSYTTKWIGRRLFVYENKWNFLEESNFFALGDLTFPRKVFKLI